MLGGLSVFARYLLTVSSAFDVNCRCVFSLQTSSALVLTQYE